MILQHHLPILLFYKFVSGHCIPGIWVAFFQECQQSRCGQDPFNNGQLLPEMFVLGRALTPGGGADVEAAQLAQMAHLLAPASAQAVLVRVLRNLANSYARSEGGAEEARAWGWLAESVAETAAAQQPEQGEGA